MLNKTIKRLYTERLKNLKVEVSKVKEVKRMWMEHGVHKINLGGRYPCRKIGREEDH